ncbi:N-acyl amino acid synthase FeeM domain-containing protein, partial [Escherichia coli]|uniref:N-acyl amino acid synthase FeeM domain-containing protein n=1 Tax=Escherichia coli TaxID=562 RepID=UPI003F799A98
MTYVAARIGWMLADYFEATYGVATVRREHMAFYRRLFGMEYVSGPRKYPLLASEIWLVGKSFDAVRSHISAKYPFM